MSTIYSLKMYTKCRYKQLCIIREQIKTFQIKKKNVETAFIDMQMTFRFANEKCIILTQINNIYSNNFENIA